MQPGRVRVEASGALLPQGQQQCAVLAEEGEPAFGAGFGLAQDLEAEHAPVELDRPVQVGDVQADVAGLERGGLVAHAILTF